MNYTIRQFKDSDLSQVLDLHDRALALLGLPVGGEWNKDLYSVNDNYKNNGGEFLVIEDDGKIIGMGAIRPVDKKTIEVKRMRIEPKLQGRGLGKKLLLKLLEIATQSGYKKVILDTTVNQIAAQKLYESCGFAKIGTGKIMNFDVIFYEKNLT